MRSFETHEVPLVLAGMYSTLEGVDRISSGDFNRGTVRLALGMVGIQLGTIGNNEGRRVFEKTAAVLSTGVLLKNGFSHLCQRSYGKAAALFAAGTAYGWLLAKSAFDPRLPVALGLMGQSALLAASGARNLRERAYAKGILKIGCALSTAAATALFAYLAFRTPEKELIFGTSYVNDLNPERNELSSLTDRNHAEYASRYGMTHVVDTKNRLENQCSDPIGGNTTDCTPYWNKIQMMREWIQEGPKESGAEEWRIFADDDMPVTNLKIDPRDAIDRLRRGDDASVIVVQDGMDWFRGDAKFSVNTGLLFVRKDLRSASLFDKVWEKRDETAFAQDPNCPTLGLCKTQKILHEQEAFARVLQENPFLVDKVVTVVSQRGHPFSDRTDLALNTFYREGIFIRAGEKEGFSYQGEDRSGVWKPGDWMGQPAGVPLKGWRWGRGVSSDPLLPARPVRKEMLEEMLAAVES